MVVMMNNFNFVTRADCESHTVRCVTEHGDNLVGIFTVVHEFRVTAEILHFGLLGSQLAVKSLPGGNKVHDGGADIKLRALKLSKLLLAATQ
jgi:hypothetical protein